MFLRFALLASLALAVTGCITATPTAPATALEQRWIGQSAGRFFAAYGPPLRDMEAADGTTLYSWRGGYINRKVCQVEIGVNSNYEIRKIRTVVDRKDPKGGPSHCEKFLDAAK
ncbi:hypothetical protein [Mycoplana dimorpha]|uniref:Lipoprotein n=1 Tax=Mycoplana dimorpha TaxID=28320 RepID=A0A2T5BHT1_MYCDI|nr:hypothetical protein [Mycoplana dimorpha]PTM98539.1 hypothetical protein C7449_101203 [Mycoplana dimorpha]